MPNRLDGALGCCGLWLAGNGLHRNRLCRRPICICRGRDAAIGSVLALSLGLGSYFITRYKSESASGPFGLLFGEILGISVHDVHVIAISAAVTIAITGRCRVSA